jgi:uncharacterized DUF497 family protein
VAVATVGAVDRITWDPEKDRQNWAKHGVSFEAVQGVLRHRLSRRWDDTHHPADEPRSITIGYTDAGVLVMIVTATDDDGRIRIISARRATKRERHVYEDS